MVGDGGEFKVFTNEPRIEEPYCEIAVFPSPADEAVVETVDEEDIVAK